MKPLPAILLACLLGLVLVAAGCTTADNGDGATPTPSEMPSPLPVPDEVVLVDDTNEGQVIGVNETASIIIKLPDNPSTGYVWKVTGSDGLAITQDTYTPAETGMVGAAGVHSWTMEPRTTGLVTFSAVYYRTWEGEKPSDDTYAISFYVVPADATLITVTADDNGDTIAVPAGDVVLVKLEENPTTGYQWNATAGGSAVIAADTYIMSLEASQGMVGAGGTHEWFVTFPDGGDGAFDAVYARPWEEPAEDAETFSVTFEAA